MPVVSLSMSDKMLEELDAVQRELGFSGRSEAVRAGIRMLVSESREKEGLSGKINSVLLVIHGQKDDPYVSEIKHRFEEVMKTQLHSHLREDKCLDIFVLEGEAEKIRDMADVFIRSGRAEYVKLLVA